MKRQPEEFASYTLEDFIDHPSFVSWILYPDEQAAIYWERIKQQFPEKLPLMNEAGRLILSIRLEADLMRAEEQELLWQAISTATSGNNKNARILPLWLRTVAAIFIVGLGIGFIFLFLNRRVTYRTSYGQVKTLMLPDSTQVTLNANSNIQYAANWSKSQAREIWLTGEAFFEVKHLHTSGLVQPGERFIAHAGNISLEVLGTAFNLKNRHGNVNAALATGRVSFGVQNKKTSTLVMYPGDIVQYINDRDTIIKKKGNPRDFSGWKRGDLHFDHTPAGEVFQYLEDTYGYNVVVKNPGILNKTLSGTFSSIKQEVLLKTIAAALGVTIRQSAGSKTLIITH